MAEVRQIPSAVGAYEAQVISFDKAYRAIVSQEQARQKQKAALAEDTQKFIERSLVDDRQIRPQESNYIAKLKEDVNNFYYENRNSILSGGSSLGELKQRMGKLKSEIGYSNSLFRQQQTLAPIVSEGLKPENDMDPVGVNRWKAFNLPINDPNRKKEFPDIDETSPVHLTYSKVINEKTDVDDVIQNQQKQDITMESLGAVKNKFGLYADMTTEVRIVPANMIQGVIISANQRKTNSFNRTFGDQLAIYKSTVPKERRDADFQAIVKAYKEVANTEIAGMFNQGSDGIDTPYEYALFSRLQNNMPYVVKKVYSYETQGMLNYGRSLSMKGSAAGKPKETLEEQMMGMLNVKSFNPTTFNEWFKGQLGTPNVATGSVLPAWTDTQKNPNGTITITLHTQTMLEDPLTGDIPDTKDKATALAKSGEVRGLKVDNKYVYYNYATKKYTINPKDPNAISYINEIVNRSVMAQSSVDVLERVKNLRRNVPQDQTVTENFINTKF
jgi:hypothetical protein